ncbi:MAG: flippase-like domain-containing protein, partial [Solirubrobacterales bacterium]|nr:flippase-like domain-containing protein [Solirubrobacterales bacterium]
AFHAYGRIPPLGVVVMGYLVGSLASALPLPAGLGAVDGGLIGALVLYGAAPAPAAAAVLLYRAVSLSLPLALGAIGWTCTPTHSRLANTGWRSALPTTRQRPQNVGLATVPGTARRRHAMPFPATRGRRPAARSSRTHREG